LVDNANRL
jgi:dynein heavy chain